MRAMTRQLFAAGTVLALAGLLTGCGTITVPIPVNLGSNSNFNVEAGQPQSKTITSTGFDTGGVTLGQGSLTINPSAISVDEATAKLLQDGECNQACEAAGLPDATCTSVCTEGNLLISVAVGTLAESGTVCDTGDQYGPFTVTIDADGNATNVSPNSVTLQTKTLGALNAGEASFCVEVVSPVTGVVVVGSLQLNAGL
jgi:hypothetical protein